MTKNGVVSECAKGAAVSLVISLLFWGLIAFVVWLAMGCVIVGHVTNNFPPGRNEVGAGARNVNDFYLYSDTGETTNNEQSYFGADIALSKDAPVIVPAGPPAPDTTPKPGMP